MTAFPNLGRSSYVRFPPIAHVSSRAVFWLSAPYLTGIIQSSGQRLGVCAPTRLREEHGGIPHRLCGECLSAATSIHVLIAPDCLDGIARRLRARSRILEGAKALRFFFHIYDNTETLDQDGIELPSIEAAIAIATHDLGQILADELKHVGMVNTASCIDVAVEDGQIIASVRFSDLLDCKH